MKYKETKLILKFLLYISVICSVLTLPVHFTYCEQPNNTQYIVQFASTSPIIDGMRSDKCWEKGEWAPIESLWLGEQPSKTDFNGRYKILWSKERLYFLLEIVDDVVSDTHDDPLKDYYKDDTLEIFIDEDCSGGDHRFNYNAFAYHISVKDFNAVDLNINQSPMLYNDHLNIKRTNVGNTYTWEIELKVFSDKYKENFKGNEQVLLTKNKVVGFGVAYCDNDGGEDRESFIGSFDIPGNDKNLAWQNASVFSQLKLVDEEKIIQKYYIDKSYYYVNDYKKLLDTLPIIKNGRTFLPIRYITEAIGAKVDWNSRERKTTIDIGDKKVELWVGKNLALVNGNTITIDSTSREVVPFISNNRTYLPIRFVSECLGFKVNWRPELKEIEIY
ncbi:stalk domain-containing protein [Pseudobacteroides cellulosolvens]|uniref:Copper amine oxidase-like domain-containing protein n=1 Tax=Pseudobacteroides cellulosolvens ATCC 35603 = DSM 2933 TaxID=398512 RepID=A0A0L6JIH2_9FIRM|nr:sugar-binding protein [Pseudobacteroides cellulosolvens]KNY25656.1 copper amine oxidase-like domain-containing protein [Pseudobacteroides cellulosolvens ATCC 35603 = DSM 2933]